MAESRSSRAVVLRWRSYGESDKIATLLTEDAGKLTGIAKGAKNSRRRFANSLEPLARVRVHFRQKPGAGLAFLESCELLAPSAGFCEPSRFAYGSYVAELTDRMTVEEDPHHNVFGLLEEALAQIERGPATSALLRAFELQLLAAAGFEPQLDACHRCRRPWRDEERAWIATHHGTVACDACRSAEEATEPVSGTVLHRLDRLKNLPLEACRGVPLGPLSADAGVLTSRLLSLHLARPLQSVKLIGQLSRPPQRDSGAR
ncbi:DNA repair protein RecO [bacterium]|nr:DNA repair protein RecO [bacterium]